MFLNIGSDFNIFYKDIVAVINIEKTTGEINNEFIENMTKSKDCVILDGIRRSVIVIEKKGKTKIYLSPISVNTIKKRLRIIERLFY